MSSKLKWKVLGILFCLLGSVYLLLPTFLDFDQKIHEAEKWEKRVPFFLNFFPKKRVNLGLDLRGGLYVEMDVDLNEAIKNRIDILLMQIERLADGQEFQGLALSRVSQTNRVHVALSADKKSSFLALLKDNFGDVLEDVSLPTEIFFNVSGIEDFPAFIQELSSALKNQNLPVADIEPGLEEGLQTIHVILSQPGGHEEVLSFISTSAFSSHLKPKPQSGFFVLQMTEFYVNHLKEMTLKQAVEAVRNRIDRYGVAEASIQRQGEDRIIAEIPGVKEPDRVIDVIRKTGLLEFRLVDEEVSESDLNAWIKEAREKNAIPEGYSRGIVEKINEALKGKIPAGDEILFEITRDPITKEIVSGVPYLVLKRADVTGDMLRNAQVGITDNEPHVSLSFNKIGAKNFGDLTKANIQKKLAIVLDGFVSKAPVIETAILDGEARITLGYGTYQSLLKEAEDLSLMLREGALPATLTVATKTVIGPSLGAESIRSGIHSMLYAALAIVIFMILYYKLAGFVANAALILNILLIFAILALFGASLTLPGIAGIVLTLGMAVDANIIIFERMREELRLGKTAKSVVESGYEHAMSAIIDSNLTTLISGIVLYQFGTGPIKGFATTLMIGILTTMFTAIVVTRVIYDYFIYQRKITRLSI